MTENERHLIQQLYDWEIRGRGWVRYDQRVGLEPPFRPFSYRMPQPPHRNAGQMPTLLSSITSAVAEIFAPKPHAIEDQEILEPAPRLVADTGEPVVEMQASLPPKLVMGREVFQSLFRSLAECRDPVALEYVATESGVIVQWAANPRDIGVIETRCESWLPEAVLTRGNGRVQSALDDTNAIGIVELGLDLEFFVPLTDYPRYDPDPLLTLIGVLGNLRPREAAIYQVLFEPVRHSWKDHMRACVTTPGGEPLFVNAPELVKLVETKTASPLYAVVIRIAVGAENEGRCRDLLRELTEALSVFSAFEESNRLVALRQRETEDADDLLQDILDRRTRRSGMILNLDELASLAHLPSVSVRTPKLVRQVRKTKAAPTHLQQGTLVLGANEHTGRVSEVSLTTEDRVRHMHVLGASGTGKSNLLLNCIVQDILAGQGVAVLDPHGDLVDKIMGYIPPDRMDDVILFDPSDEEYPVGFNILSAKSDLERTLLASDLCAVFRRQSTSWGDQMTTVLSNAILAFLESTTGGTLGDLRRFLLEEGFRKSFLKTVQDPEVIYFWERNFPQVSGKPQASIVTRLDAFLRPKAVRYMVCQKDSPLDFAEIMDTGKVFLAKLPQGLIGQENAHLFGTLLVSKFQQTAIARQAMAAESRRDFWLYIDECHNFVTPSMGDILTGSRKYRLGLILAHQELRQLLNRDVEVGSAVLANPATRVCFRLGEEDARKMAEGFSFFDASDLVNLGTGEAIGRVKRSDSDFNLRIPVLPKPVGDTIAAVFVAVREKTRRVYARRREEVVAEYMRANEWRGEPEQKEKREKRPAKKPEPEETPISEPDVSIIRPRAPLSSIEHVIVSKPIAKDAPASETSSTNLAEPLETLVPPAPQTITPPAPSEDIPKLADILAESHPKSVPKIKQVEETQPRSLGRGGLEHQYLQRYLKEIGEQFGYRATIEKTIEGGSVDVLWELDGKVIALEISITTGSEHEAQNIEKCLAAGFASVIAIGNDGRKLARLQKAIEARLSEEQLKRIAFHSVESLVMSLSGAAAKPAKGKKKVCGYDVTTAAPTGKNATGNADKVVHDAVAKALMRMKSKK